MTSNIKISKRAVALTTAAALLAGSAIGGLAPSQSVSNHAAQTAQTQQADQTGTELAFAGPAAGSEGAWGGLENWPLIAIHAALDANGNVVTYGTNGDGQQTGRFIYDVWTPGPTAAGGHATLANTTQTDLFCSLQLNRADNGEMILFGGDNWTGANTTNTGNQDINVLNPNTQQMTQLPGMQRARWYATGTTLPDGRIFVQGGDGGIDKPEVWSPETGSQLLDLDTSGLSWWYPRNFVLPDGRIFGIDVEGRMYYISADLTNITMVGQLGVDRHGTGATAVMYEPGKILHFGGPTNTAVTIDANGAYPVVTAAAAPSTARDWVDSTLLPDGRILATGGAENYQNSPINAPIEQFASNNSAEIWDPETGTWDVDASGIAPRLYHSTTLLLPDGRVLVAGGGAPGPVANTNAEIFTPDYLINGAGGANARPAIDALSSNDLVPGAPLAINFSGTGAARVTLVKSGSVTHSFNMDQRFIELPFTANGNTINTAIPASGTQVTPGYYLLTVLDANGVPSESRMIRIAVGGNNQGAPAAPAAPGPNTSDSVTRLYRAYFGRNPDAAGHAYWTGQLQNGFSLAEISQEFAQSNEFVSTYGVLPNAQFVNQLYLNVLGRPADPGGLAFWNGILANGVTRGAVMLEFSESAEFIAVVAANPDPVGGPPAPGPAPAPAPVPAAAQGSYANQVSRLYQAYFQRDPEVTGLNFWVSERTAGISLDVVSQNLADSNEFIATYGAATNAQFVDLAYANVFGRAPDAEGQQFWIGLLNGGLSRGEIMAEFSESDEFVLKTGLAR